MKSAHAFHSNSYILIPLAWILLTTIFQSCSFQVHDHLAKPLGCKSVKTISLAVSLFKQSEQPNMLLEVLTTGRISSFLSFTNTPDWGLCNCSVYFWLMPAGHTESFVNQTQGCFLFCFVFPSVRWLKGTSCEAIIGLKERKRHCRKRRSGNPSPLFMQLTCDFRTYASSLIYHYTTYIPFSLVDGL